jgi:Helix-turn-helix domain
VIEDQEQVPTALYRVFGAGDEPPLYIGISDNFGRRWTEHARVQPWWGEKRRLTVEWFDSRPLAEAAEEAAIKAEHPRHNFMHNQGTPERHPTQRPRRIWGGDRLLGAHMRRLRTGRGMSQGAVAGLMRDDGWPWHQTTVARVECGDRPLGFGEGIDLAGHLGISPEEFCELAAMSFGDNQLSERGKAA